MVDGTAGKMIPSRERLWEPQFKETVLTMSADTSYAKTIRFTNTLLAREHDSLITRTLIDLAWREGHKAGECYKEKRNTILSQYGFNAETGQLEDSSRLPDNVINPNPDHSEEDLAEYAAKIGQLIETYNSDHEVGISMTVPEIISALEYVPDDAVVICIDEVGVKHQKEYRKEENRKKAQAKLSPEEVKLENAENVETAVAYIRCAEGIYRIAEKTITLALLTALAFLLSNGLLADRRLLFFTDGARNLKRAIESIYSFRPFTINLDWIHVKKYCYQLLTMALYGGKENHDRNEKIRSGFFNYIWVGDIEGSKKYLDSIDNSYIKNPKKIQAVKDYLDRKSGNSDQQYFYCYAMRKELGLINSSNQGEKSNDILIAQRQKHNGMSWVVDGSSALGHIKQISINEESDYFYRTGKIMFEPVKLTKTIQEKYKYRSIVA